MNWRHKQYTGSLSSMLAVLALLGPPAGASRIAQTELRWMDPQGRRPMSFAAWQSGRGLALDHAGIGTVTRTGCTNLVDVLVNPELYAYILPELAQYQADLVAAGYSVQVDTTRSMSHAALRGYLVGISNLVGVLLVGELPVAWYELDGEEFPTDLYFMDLNGTWVDADNDGLYDGHTGNTNLEIWVGRLYARPLTWDDEVRLVRHYFAKDHAYRTGGLSLPDRALSYVDDDWSSLGDCELSRLYTSVTTVNQGNTTRASDYRVRLGQGYEWIQVCAHSSPWGHTFRADGGYRGTVFNSEIYAMRPLAHFYNLFACSGTRFVEENYSAGWDIFQDDYGLVAVGSTKTGSMIGYFGDFYGPMANDTCIGDAFKAWYALHGESSRFWHYGLNILGDPTLRPRHGGGGKAEEPVPAAVPTFSEVVCADPETDDSPYLMAAPDRRVWAIWKSGRSQTNGRFDIYSAVRWNGNWSSAYTVGNAYYWETDPVLGLDRSDRPVAVWSLFTDDYYYNLFYSVWVGGQWLTPREVSNDPSSDMAPSLSRDSTGTLWCLFLSRRDEFPDVFATSYNGSAWSEPVNITRDTVTQLNPSAAAMPDSSVWVAYTEYRGGAAQVWGRCRSGSEWVETGPISGAQRRAFRPTITADETGNPIVCWQSFDSGQGCICWSRFEGETWSAPLAVDPGPGLDVRPQMARDVEGRPWVVWMSDRTGEWDVYCSRYSGGGWGPALPVEAEMGPDMNPSIAASGGSEVCIAWQNLAAGNWDIHARSLPLTGVTEEEAGTATLLLAVPNPSSRSVRFSVGQCSAIEITNALGRIVAVLRPDRETTEWQGTDIRGARVPAGIFFARATGQVRDATIQILRTR